MLFGCQFGVAFRIIDEVGNSIGDEPIPGPFYLPRFVAEHIYRDGGGGGWGGGGGQGLGGGVYGGGGDPKD